MGFRDIFKPREADELDQMRAIIAHVRSLDKHDVAAIKDALEHNDDREGEYVRSAKRIHQHLEQLISDLLYLENVKRQDRVDRVRAERVLNRCERIKHACRALRMDRKTKRLAQDLAHEMQRVEVMVQHHR